MIELLVPVQAYTFVTEHCIFLDIQFSFIDEVENISRIYQKKIGTCTYIYIRVMLYFLGIIQHFSVNYIFYFQLYWTT